MYAVRLAATGGATSVGAESQRLEQTPDRLLRSHLAVSYGGLAAEIAIYSDSTMSAESDLETSTELLLRRIGAGLDPGFPPVSPSGFGRYLPDELADLQARAVVATAKELHALATSAVAANLAAIRKFAASLAARELTGEALQAVIAEAGFVRLERETPA